MQVVCVTREERALPEEIRNAAKVEIFRRIVEKLMLLTMWRQRSSVKQIWASQSLFVCLFICLFVYLFKQVEVFGSYYLADVDYHSCAKLGKKLSKAWQKAQQSEKGNSCFVVDRCFRLYGRLRKLQE